MTWFDFELLIIMYWLWMNIANVSTTSATAQREVSYSILPADTSPDIWRPEVFWVNSTTSSIAIRWTLKQVNKSRTIVGSHVEYFVDGGKFSSHLLHKGINSYVFRNLLAETMYTICVKVYLKHQGDQSMQETKEHSSCVQIWTIPYIRKDSVVTLLLTSSYFVFMALMGYSQWRMKIQSIRTKNRRNTSRDQNVPIRGRGVVENNIRDYIQPLRWRELEENDGRRYMFTSIEDHH